jgi:drug/metabolite transporter (DMT)-like permease
VIVASAVVLSEEISLARWFGIALITLGIVVVAASTSKMAAQEDQRRPSPGQDLPGG